jgi:chloramphenicol-sensitive protein RarD
VAEERPDHARAGLLYGLAAYGLWGLVPLYFKAIVQVPPAETLAHRVVWSVVFLAGVLSLTGRWPDLVRCFRSRPLLLILLASTLLIGLNWFVFIYAVSQRQVLETSLGYFITPLVNVLLGMVFFGERLRPRQWLALTLAAGGVLILAVAAGQVPWIALTLAVSFGTYGLLRKMAPIDGLISLAVETLLLFPAAVGFLGFLAWDDAISWGAIDRTTDVLLPLSGVVTTVPLLCFGAAARRLRLSTLGFLQYLSPSLAFLLAVGPFGEPFTTEQMASFGCIWTALAIYSADSVLAYRRRGGNGPQAQEMP